MSFIVILYVVIKGSLYVSLFPLRPEINVIFISTDFETKSYLFLPLFSYAGIPLFLTHSLSLQSFALFLSLESNWQNCPKHLGTAASATWLRSPDEDPSSAALERKHITNSCFALLSNCYCDLWDGFNNPSMVLLGFWFLRLLFFPKPLFQKSYAQRQSFCSS